MLDFHHPSPMPVPQITPIQPSETIQPTKKRRNLPGMPDPEAEVIALSPATLLATNRFVCEVCNKGFQRDQNLQLHRRGHNLPWKLKQRDDKKVVQKRVYVCPEKTCVHHNPTRALGDLTGIKKHFSRKHGEKKWSCERCLKKYAVRSDWKAHVKACGMKEYGCGCGAVFSRKDSFISHRAFCDALSQTRDFPVGDSDCVRERNEVEAVVFSPVTVASGGVVSPTSSIHSPDSPEKPPEIPQHQNSALTEAEAAETYTITTLSTGSAASDSNNATTTTTAALATFFESPTPYSDLICNITGADHNLTLEPNSIYQTTDYHRQFESALPAVDLLQEGQALPLPSSYSTDDCCQEIGGFGFLPATTTVDFLGLGVGGGADVYDGGYSAFLEEVGLM